MKQEPVCERTYQTTVVGTVHAFAVRWFKPEPWRGDWRCEFEIGWPGKSAVRRAIYGVDSTQAFYLALEAAAAELYLADPPVYWWEPDDILCLPISSTLADLEACRTKGRP